MATGITSGEKRVTKAAAAKKAYSEAVIEASADGTSITHEEQLNFKIAMFPLIMQVVYNCGQLIGADVEGEWYKFRDGDYAAAKFDCETVLTFARRILGYEPQHRVEMENGEKRMFRILEGKDAKQILSDFREYVDEAQRNDSTRRHALYAMKEAIEDRNSQIEALTAKCQELKMRKDNPLSAVHAFRAFKKMYDNIGSAIDDMEDSICITKDHAERDAIGQWVKALKKERQRSFRNVEQFRNYLEKNSIYVFDKNGNIDEEAMSKAFGEDESKEEE